MMEEQLPPLKTDKEPGYYTRADGTLAHRSAATPHATEGVDVQGIAAIAWRCIRQCKDYEGPPVMCPAHQEEAKALAQQSATDKATEIDGEGVLPNTANKADTSTSESRPPRTPFAVCLCGHTEPMHRPMCQVALCECNGFAASQIDQSATDKEQARLAEKWRRQQDTIGVLQEKLRQHSATDTKRQAVVAQALSALESDATYEMREGAFDALRDEFYPWSATDKPLGARWRGQCAKQVRRDGDTVHLCQLEEGHIGKHSMVPPTEYQSATDTTRESSAPLTNAATTAKGCDTCRRLQAKLTLNEQEHQRVGSILQGRVDYLEGTAIPHARKQENANGFQAGWHSVLDRLRDGDALGELRGLVPDTRSVK